MTFRNKWNIKHITGALIPMFLLCSAPVDAQSNRIYRNNYKTLNLCVNDNQMLPPIITLNSDDCIEISFDEMSHEYKTLKYRIVHCNEDWEQSSLLDIDCLEGFNDNEIENSATSFNTTTDYTHYSFVLPNEYVRFKVSGNYRVDVYNDENPDVVLLSACIYVLDHKVNTMTRVSSNTDIDTNVSHQQLTVTLGMTDGFSIRQPQRELKVNVLQNRRTDNIAKVMSPTFISNTQIRYEHVKELIFPAGNEYRRFEMINNDDAMMGVESIGYFAPYYHTTLYEDTPRMTYDFDRDQNGMFFIRNDRARDNGTEADYMLVHFALRTQKEITGGDIYLSGAFTNNAFGDANKMTYNPRTGTYECVQQLKQGLYNYIYLFRPHNNGIAEETTMLEGNFYETENEYMVLVYYRPIGERYDMLIGASCINS